MMHQLRPGLWVRLSEIVGVLFKPELPEFATGPADLAGDLEVLTATRAFTVSRQ